MPIGNPVIEPEVVNISSPIFLTGNLVDEVLPPLLVESRFAGALLGAPPGCWFIGIGLMPWPVGFTGAVVIGGTVVDSGTITWPP